MADDSPYVMSPMEIVWGYTPGHMGALPPSTMTTADPRRALEDVVRDALLHPPCGVAFSGGRDSSVVLAVATHVARRDGLAEPVAITQAFPSVPNAEESEWQEQVIRHIGLSDWQRVVIDDEMDLVGPLAATHLMEHGVLWPPTVHGDLTIVEHLRGGSLIDGEGGDEVLGVAAHRIAPMTHLIRAPRPLRWRRVRSALRAMAPARVRSNHLRRRWNDEQVPWLRPAGLAALMAAMHEVEAVAPLSFAASVRMVPRRRSQVLMARNRRILSRRHGVQISSPLLHPEVVHALARAGGPLGQGDRTATLRGIVPDLLPDAVLARSSKAEFGGVFWSRHSRCFAERWTGDGVDTDLVDPEGLRQLWLSEKPKALTSALLQQAWLAAVGSSHTPARGD